MEALVTHHPRHLILRLPQVAGRTPNPHTLLNYLYARISRGESFRLWRNARCNIIDVDDVAAIGKHAIYESTERGSGYPIDTRAISHLLEDAGVTFGPDYLERVLDKYYGKHD